MVKVLKGFKPIYRYIYLPIFILLVEGHFIKIKKKIQNLLNIAKKTMIINKTDGISFKNLYVLAEKGE